MADIDYVLAVEYNGKEIADGSFTRQMIVRLVEEWQKGHPGLTVDGKCGPKTQASIASRIPAPAPAPIKWLPWDGPLAKQPRNRTEMYAMFGTPGPATSVWAKAHIIEVQGANAFPSVPSKWYVKVHEELEPYTREGLRRAKLSSPYRIDRCGGYVYRHAQFDQEMPLSYHAWGAALDFDDDRNGPRRFPVGSVPAPWSPEWMAIWPNGVDEQFVLAMESCGYRWGGRWTLPGRDGLVFVDPEHFEWVGTGPV